MTDRELMQQALEALEWVNTSPWLEDCYHAFDKEVAALRERLAQPEQEQEPFAWVDESAIRWLADRKGKTSAHCTTQLSAARSCEQPMPIYTAPQRREWVGLTRDEVLDTEETAKHPLEFARAIEAKLKEKNT